MKKCVIGILCLSMLVFLKQQVYAEELLNEKIVAEQTQTSSSKDKRKSESDTLKAAGIYGTVPWMWEKETQTITFGGGDFPTGGLSNSISQVIEDAPILEGKRIKKIIFTDIIKANENSSYLFYDLVGLETLENAELLDTSQVTEMSWMLTGLHELVNIDVSHWDTSNVTTMSAMFNGLSELARLDVSNWNTSQVRDMSFMFTNSSKLESLDVGNWDTSHVTTMNSMFFGTTGLTSLNVSHWDTSQVTDMSYMFAAADNLSELDVSNWNMGQITTLSAMFHGASSLTKLDVGSWDTSQVTDLSHTFYGVSGLTTLDISHWDTSQVTNMSGLFFNANNLINLDVSGWNTSRVTDMSYMFHYTYKVKKLDVSDWETGQVRNMKSMFDGAAGLEKLNISSWDTSQVTDISWLFSGLHNLTNLDVSNFDTSQVTDMSGMFAKTSMLKSLDVSNFNTSQVTDMSFIFYGSSSLTTLDLSNWSTEKVTSTYDMLSVTDALDTLILGKNSRFGNDKNPNLSEKTVSPYTGRWVLISGDKDNNYSSSADFMMNYDGTKPGTYVRERTDEPIKVTGIELHPLEATLQLGEELVLQPIVSPEQATNKNVTYATSNQDIATVDTAGKVTAVGVGKATITATTEYGSFKANTTITVTPDYIFSDVFYLGIDEYITGEVDAGLKAARKVQLVVNGNLVKTANLFSDKSFELEADGNITKVTDKVEVVVLDKKNVELGRVNVTIKMQTYSLTVNPFILYEQTEVTGKTDFYHTHVALVIDGEEVARQLLSATREFSFDVDDWIDYEDDEVEIVGYRYGQEITRRKIAIQVPNVEMKVTPYVIGEPYVSGKVTGNSAKSVLLYVNRKRQQIVRISEDGSFNLLGLMILSPQDTAVVAVLNAEGVETHRFSVPICY